MTIDVSWDDLMRILTGGLPWTFLAEVIFRGTFLYFLLFFSMRLMGRRMARQLSRIEMAALVSLAATVGLPMQSPENGLLPALIAAGTIVAVHNLVTHILFRNKYIENFLLEGTELLVSNGCFQISVLQKNVLSKELVTAQLRSYGLKNLADVRRLYYEPSGGFTLVRDDQGKPGLSLIPDWDTEMINRATISKDVLACSQCGSTRNKDGHIHSSCNQCQCQEWVAATCHES